MKCSACSGSGYFDNCGSPRCYACGGTGKTIIRNDRTHKMKVKDLIKGLLKCPQDLDIELYYDGSPGPVPDFAYLRPKDEYKDEIVVLGESASIYNLEENEKILFDEHADDN